MKFDEMLYKAFDMYAMEEAERLKNIDIDTNFSDNFKIKINRLYRERLGGKKPIHPEVDNKYERIRSNIIHYLFFKKKC